MKRFLSILLCSLLLLALLPLTAPPAKMTAPFQVSVNVTSAWVGDTLHWTVYGLPPGGPYTFCYAVYLNGLMYDYDGTYSSQNTFAYTPEEAGIYTLLVLARQASPYWQERVDSANTTVTTRPSLAFGSIHKVESVSSSAIKVTLNKVTNATGYEVYISTQSSLGYKLVKSTTALTFTKTYLQAGVRYYFKVRPFAKGTLSTVYGAYSAPQAGVPLAKPVISSAVGTGKDRVKLTWGAVPGASGYQIYKCGTAAGQYLPIKTTTATTFTVTGLKPGTTYYFKVAAYKRIYTTNYYGPLSVYKAGKTQ